MHYSQIYRSMKQFFFLFFLLFATASMLSAQQNKAQLISSDADETLIKFTLNNYKFHTVKTAEGSNRLISAEGLSPLLKEGAPELLKFSEAIIISDIYDTELEIIKSEYTDIHNIEIAPSKGNLLRMENPANIPYSRGTVYEKDEFFPGRLAKLNEPYIMRDYRGQSIHVYPFRYNPVKKVLRVYSEILVKVSNNNKTGKNPLTRKTNKNTAEQEFELLYKQRFLNYTQKKYTPLTETGNMLVICHNDWTNEMQAFVDWKNTTGRKTEMLSTAEIGNTAEEIKEFTENYYYTKGLAYLLLVGDSEQIPTNNGDDLGGDSDNAYAYVAGDDHYLDFFVGRFSAESAEDVQTQVKRTIDYEKGNTLPDNWLNLSTGIASEEGPGDAGEYDYEHYRNLAEDLLNYTYTESLEFFEGSQGGNDASGHPSANMVAEAINTGTGIINYTGHGSPYSWGTSGFNSNNINQLNNINKLPFIWSVACVNGYFVDYTCFAENWLRATHNGQPAGAVAIMASTINQSWGPPMAAQDEMVDILTESYQDNIKRSFAGISIDGCHYMNDTYGDFAMTDTWTCFGDPSLLLRTDNPEAMEVSHAETLLFGSQEFIVSTDAENAQVSLSAKGKLLSSAKVSGGQAVLSAESVQPDDLLTIAVSGYNKITYISELPVETPEGPYVIADAYDIEGETTINYGESGNVSLKLMNVGKQEAANVSASVTTEDEYVISINNNNNLNFGNIAGDFTTADASETFSIEIADNTPDKHLVKLNVTAISGDKQWESSIDIKINSPNTAIAPHFVSEDDNTNTRLDPGETGNINFTVTNTGSVDAEFYAELALKENPDNYLIANNTNDGPVDIPAGASYNFIFEAYAKAETPLETEIGLELSVFSGSSAQYSSTVQQELIIGLIPLYNIDTEGELTVCTGTFYDSGGADNPYENDESYNMTFYPTESGKMLNFKFQQFNVEHKEEGGCWDELKIYNGSNASAELIGTFCGNSIPEVLENLSASNPEGALHFAFSSDPYVTESGWIADISCTDAYTVNFIVNDGNQAIPNAEIRFAHQTISTDAEGEALFENVPAGTHRYTATAQSMAEFTGELEIADDAVEYITMSVSNMNTIRQAGLRIAPNPSSGIINFYISGTGDLHLEIYNPSGQKVHSETTENHAGTLKIQSDLSHLKSGIYFVKIANENKHYFKKLLIQR